MDPIVHFELPADDVERARAFYSKTFGWKPNSIPGMGYTLWHTTTTDANGMVQTPGTINGGMLTRQEPVSRLVVTVMVKDLETALKAAQANGGKVVRGKQEVKGVGWAAYIDDTEGNRIGLIQSSRA